MIVNKIRKIQDILLSITALLYLLITFIIWDVNYSGLSNINANVYNLFTYVIITVLLININRINFRVFIKDSLIFIIIIFLLIINSYFIPYGDRSRDYVLNFIPVFLLVILLYRKTFNLVIKYGFIILLGLFSLYNLLGILGAFFKFQSFFGLIPNELIDNYRYSSILRNPNALGEFAYIAFLIITFFTLLNTETKKRIVYLILYILTGFALIVSGSRNAIMMVGIIYIVILLYLHYLDDFLRKLIKYISISGLSLITLAFIFKGEFIINLLRLNQGLTGRDEIWTFLIHEIKKNFIFGIGYNFSPIFIADTKRFDVSSSHNMYLGLLLEMGIVAFLCLIAWIVYMIIKNHKYIKLNTSERKYLIIYNCFYISFFIGQFFEFSFFKISAINTFTFMIIALNYVSFNNIVKTKKEKIKVAHMITGLSNGGAESMLFKILKYTDKNKFDLVVISMSDKGYYGDKIKQLGIPVVELNLKKPQFLIINLFRLLRSLKGTDVLQTWLYHANFFGLILGKLLGVKNIIWGIRQSNVDEENNKKLTVKIAKLSAKFSKYVTHILSCSDEATKVHIALGYDKSKFRTIYNGFELDKYYFDEGTNAELKEELSLNDEIIISNVARYDIQKDHNTLLKAINIIYNEYNIKNIKLLLCGLNIDESNKALCELIKENMLDDCVKLLGVRSDINKIMSASDIFVLSSLGEGFPNVLGEAMACNTPSVVTDVGDCKAIVGDCGIVVDKQNPKQLADAIRTLIDLPKQELVQLGNKARERILLNYDIKNITKQYETLYGD